MTPQNDLRTLFETCVSQCADSMYRVAFRLTGSDAKASDLIQETYLNAWKNIATLQNPARVRSWIFSILRNQYSKLIRQESRVQVSSSDLDEVAETKNRDIANESQEQVDEIQTAVNQLDDEFKIPLLLSAIEEMKPSDIAEVLQLPKATVLTRIHRARKKLKQILNRFSIEIG